MTWRNCSKSLVVAILGSIALALASQARAENTLISPQEAEALVRAQMEEQKAAAAALQEEQADAEADMRKPGKAAKAADRRKLREAAAAVSSVKDKAGPSVETVKEAAGGTVKEASIAETASLPADLSMRPRLRQADSVKAQALKPLIARYAAENGLPFELADAVVRLESRYNPAARRGMNVGLTQIHVRSAQSLGYKGDAAGLLDAETNLRYGLKYLAVAYRLAASDTCGAILRYQFGLRATTMTGASRAYCAKVKVLTAAAD